jgi:hypothetical protein
MKDIRFKSKQPKYPKLSFKPTNNPTKGEKTTTILNPNYLIYSPFISAIKKQIINIQIRRPKPTHQILKKKSTLNHPRHLTGRKIV